MKYEKFFLVKKESTLYEKYREYKENEERTRLIYLAYKIKTGVESYEYAAFNNCLYIKPTERDNDAFGIQFKMETFPGGLKMFKKNSRLGKLWVGMLESKGFTILRKPQVNHYFRKYVAGSFSERLFESDGVLYGSFGLDHPFDMPNDFEELKGSEFFKVIEDHNERNSKENEEA